MSLLLPRIPPTWVPATEMRRNQLLELADRENHKRNQDIEVGNGKLILTDSATGTRYELGITYGGITVSQMDGTDVSVDANIRQAERVILSTYGDTVSVAAKAKNLGKFGRNITVGTAFETVGELQGTTANETFATTNSIDSIVSDNTGNNDTVLTLEGHTIDGSGNLTFSTQDVTLAATATTPVTLGTPIARANRLYVKNTGTFNSPEPDIVGNVYVYDATVATGVTAGVPDVAAATKLMLVAENQSQKAAVSTSSTEYWILTAFTVGVGSGGGAAARVRARVETRDVFNGGVWRPLGSDNVVDLDQNAVRLEFSPYLIVPKNHDVRVRALVNANTADVYAEVEGYLASVQ